MTEIRQPPVADCHHTPKEAVITEPLLIEKISANYWSVYRGARDVGCVLGGGPTEATRFKAIHKNDNWVNPEVAEPVGFAPTLEEAAKLLD